MGDWVEVISRGHRNTPRTGRIREMLWEPRSKSLQYLITENGRPVAKMYTRPDLRHVDPTEALTDIQVDVNGDVSVDLATVRERKRAIVDYKPSGCTSSSPSFFIFL